MLSNSPHRGTNMDPILPLDLERVIFEVAARADFSSIPTFMRVAWRVHSWLQPILYHALHLNPDHIESRSDLSVNLTRRLSFYRDTVRHLYLTPTRVLDPQLCLATCTGLQTLFIDGPPMGSHNPVLPSLVQQLRSLTRLHAHFVDLFSQVPWEQRGTFFDALPNITHLEMREPTPSAAVCAGLVRLPRLTHIALHYQSRARGTIALCLSVLKECKTLRVLAALQMRRSAHGPDYEAIDTPRNADNDDVRFVLVVYRRSVYSDAKQWLAAVRSGRVPAYWECAEEVVAARIAR
ncbi:hypothetical protein C8R46DRAFT_1361488 [Mycena filopes]|nr:hypothetical protein C8R46DRAFT_1361488 [Mycena filopes]